MQPVVPLLLLLAALAAGCGGQQAATGLPDWKDVDTPEALKSALAQARGKPVILKIWADW